MQQYWIKGWQSLAEPQEYISKQPENKRFTIIIKNAGSYSQQQQGYYRGVCVPTISEAMGHKWIDKFTLSWIEVLLDSKKYVHMLIKWLLNIETSTDMDKEEYSGLIDASIKLAEFLGVTIPPPIS